MPRIKGILLAAFLLISAFTELKAVGLSYIYIQGDKQTPFYVKLEGEMQPRYGKNYCIISKLAPGPLQIEILFQQNEYPAEKFTVQVPANGSRGFMLTKKDGVYALYDLQQGYYLSPGNKAGEDMASVSKVSEPAEPVVAVNTPPKTVTPTTILPKPNTITNKPENKPPVKNITKPVEQPKVVTKPVDNGQPKFIDNIELNNERTFGSEENNAANSATIPTPNKTAVANSDCPKPLPFSEYQDILEKARGKNDKNRLKYLLEQTDKCYTTIQVRALTRSLEKDPERYAFLKQVFPRVTDQSNFSMLETTLQSKEWKEYFKLILP